MVFSQHSAGRRLAIALIAFVVFVAAIAGCGRPAPGNSIAGQGGVAPAPAPAQPPQNAEQPYMVLKPGSVYIYRTASGAQSRMEVREPSDLSDPGSGRTARGYEMVWEDETVFVTMDKDWVYDVGDLGEGGPMVYKTPKPDFPLFPKQGQTWTRSFADEFEGAGSFVSTVTGFEAVETPAGKFERAARVEVTFQSPDGATDHWVEWYAPGVGRVKTSNGLELVEFKQP